MHAGIDIEEAAANALLTESDQDEDEGLEAHPTNRIGAAIVSQDDQAVNIGLGENTFEGSQLIQDKKV